MRDDDGNRASRSPWTEPVLTSSHEDPGSCQWFSRLTAAGATFVGSGSVFGFPESLADRLDLVTEQTGAKDARSTRRIRLRTLSGWVSPKAAGSSRSVTGVNPPASQAARSRLTAPLCCRKKRSSAIP